MFLQITIGINFFLFVIIFLYKKELSKAKDELIKQYRKNEQMRELEAKHYYKKKLEIKIPKNFMNCAISKSNVFIADTNDCSNSDKLKIPLPTPKIKWQLFKHDIKENIVYLVDKHD